MMKSLLCALLLVSVFFASVTVTESDHSTDFYTRNIGSIDSRFHATPHLWFEEVLTASTDSVVLFGNPSDLHDGAIICEGDVNMDVDPDGTYAHGGFGLYAHFFYVQEQCQPATYSGYTERSIYWNNYDIYRLPSQTCVEGGSYSCWGDEGTLNRQEVTYERTASVLTGRRGNVAAVCDGSVVLRRDGTPVSTLGITGSGSTVSGSTYLGYGTHTISSIMDIDGCAIINRLDPCLDFSGWEELFTRTSPGDGPEYSNTVGPASITLNVMDDAHIRCDAEIVSVEPSPITLGEDESLAIDITIRNPPCPSGYYCMPVVVSGVTVNDPFRWFRVVTSGTPPFVIRPGESRTYRGSLIAPSDLSTAPDSVIFTVHTNCANFDGSIATDCGGDNRPLEIPVEIPFDREEENETELNIIPVLPGNMTIQIGNETPDIDLTTRVIGGPSNSGHSRFWLFSDVNGTFTLLDFAEWRVPALTDADWPHPYGRLTCEEEMDYWVMMLVDVADTTVESNEDDNFDYFVVHCRDLTEPGPEDHYCEIEPPEYEGLPGESYEFDLYCDGTQDDCYYADDVDWDVTEHGTLEDYNDIWANVTVDEGLVVTTEYETVTVTATVDYGEEGDAVCTAQIIIPNTEVECIYYV